jgi:hypothetical protein
MKFHINLSGKTLYTFMRETGYAPASAKATAGRPQESVFQRPVAGRPQPRFHIYASASQDNKSAVLNLHLDQKQVSYAGSHAHSGEYEGSLVENEAARIQAKSGA